MKWTSKVPEPTVPCYYWFRCTKLAERAVVIRWHRVKRTGEPERIECYYPIALSYDGAEWSDQPALEPEEPS